MLAQAETDKFPKTPLARATIQLILFIYGLTRFANSLLVTKISNDCVYIYGLLVKGRLTPSGPDGIRSLPPSLG